MAMKNEGVCRFCLKRFSGPSMGRHLVACKAKKQADQEETASGAAKAAIYHIRIVGYKIFWLHIEMPSTATLAGLDKFLRHIWVECCGHLSEFTIHGERYSAPFENDWGGVESKSTDIALSEVLQVKDQFEYVYDFGSSTELEGQVVAERAGVLGEKVKVLARNNSPGFECEDCDSEATQICTECWDFYCDRCLEAHGCGDDMALPVVNSPRMGVCGYVGNEGIDPFVIPEG